MRRVELRYQVGDFGIIREGLKSMGESGRDVDLTHILGSELEGEPIVVCRRARAQVDHDVEDRAADTGNQLHLRVWILLIMQTAQRASFDRM